MKTQDTTTTKESTSRAAANQPVGVQGVSLFSPHSKFTIQPKLSINNPDDVHERDADEAADQIMRMVSPPDQTEPLPVSFAQYMDSTLENNLIQAKFNPIGSGNPPEIQRESASNNESFKASSFATVFNQVRIAADSQDHKMHKEFTPFYTAAEKPFSNEPSPAIQKKSIFKAQRLIQRTEDNTLRLCPRYWRYETPRLFETYNCAGLAFRNYVWWNLPQVLSALGAGRQSSSCNEGEVKFWLWTYNLHFEDYQGNIIQPAQPDFHIVGGISGTGGADPTDVYSKNGKRPVYGPGTGPSFRPPAREHGTESSPAETLLNDANGNPIYKVRTAMQEANYCLRCP